MRATASRSVSLLEALAAQIWDALRSSEFFTDPDRGGAGVLVDWKAIGGLIGSSDRGGVQLRRILKGDHDIAIGRHRSVKTPFRFYLPLDVQSANGTSLPSRS